MKQLWDLAGVFAYLSLLTVGGGMAAFPEMKTLTVDTYHWVTFPELLHFYSLGQLAPGPNMMMVASIGVTVAHLPGALVALVAFFLPTGLLTLFVGRLWTHLATWRWRPSIQTGLGSVAVGLVLAGAIIMGRGAITEFFFGVIALAVFLLLWRTKINPAYPIVASGLIGMALHVAIEGWLSRPGLPAPASSYPSTHRSPPACRRLSGSRCAIRRRGSSRKS